MVDGVNGPVGPRARANMAVGARRDDDPARTRDDKTVEATAEEAATLPSIAMARQKRLSGRHQENCVPSYTSITTSRVVSDTSITARATLLEDSTTW